MPVFQQKMIRGVQCSQQLTSFLGMRLCSQHLVTENTTINQLWISPSLHLHHIPRMKVHTKIVNAMNGTTRRTKVHQRAYQWYAPPGIPGADVEEQEGDLPSESSPRSWYSNCIYISISMCLSIFGKFLVNQVHRYPSPCHTLSTAGRYGILEVGHTTDKCTYIICCGTFACPSVQFKFGIWYQRGLVWDSVYQWEVLLQKAQCTV